MRAKCLLNHDLLPEASKSSSLAQGRKFKYLPLELAHRQRLGTQTGVGKYEGRYKHEELRFPTILHGQANYNSNKTNLHLRDKLYICTLAFLRTLDSCIEISN
jgi:hypothetical protein